MQVDENDIKLLVSEIFDIEKMQLKILYIKINFDKYNDLKEIIKENLGNTPVVIYFADKKKTVKLDEKLWVDTSEEKLENFINFLGKENVKLN